MKNFVALLFLLLFVSPGLPHAIHAQQKPTYEIGILTDIQTTETIPLIEALQAEIIAVVGEDALVTFPEEYTLVNNFDVSTAESHYQTLLNNETDIILAFGGINNLVISQQTSYPKPTLLFGSLNLDLIPFDITQETSGIDNLNLLITSQSYRSDLTTFKSLFDFKHLGVLVDQSIPGMEQIEAVIANICVELAAEYTIIPYDEASDLTPYLDQIDAAYLAEGFILTPDQISELADILFEQEIPSFTSTSVEDVELGLMATNQAAGNIGVFFRRIALNIEAAINGANLGTLPIYFESDQTLTLNFNTAEKARVPLRYSSVANTEFVGDFKNVISERTYSLVDIIEELLDRNLSLQLTQKNVELTNQDVRSARSTYLPDVTASASGTYIDQETAELSNGQNPEYSTDGNITVSQTIFSEAANANISIQQSLLDAERENYNATELDLILSAANAYFNALILKANVAIRSENLNVTRQNLDIAEQNFEAGQAGQSDVLRFRSELAQNQQALVESINQLEQSFISINELLNHSISREIDIEDATLSTGVFERYNYQQFSELLDDPTIRVVFVEFLIEEAKKNAPELRSLEYNMAATERSILANGGRRFLPTIAAQAQYNRTFDQWGVGVPPPEFALDDNFSVGVSLSIPIFDQNQRNINRQTSIIQLEQLVLNQNNTERSIEADVQTGVLDVINQIANIQLSQVSEEAARTSLELTQTAYSSGSVNIAQLLDAQNNFVQAQLSRLNASYNFLLASLVLERYIGYYFLLNSEADNDAFLARFFTYLSNSQE